MEEIVAAIQAGDVEALQTLLRANPGLATTRIDGQRTPLHIATDWPGHFPNGPATVVALIEAGADVNAPFISNHQETPLHWAASTDDVPVLDALLDHGANIEAAGSVIGGGTPLADAVAFGRWNAARRLVERGAQANLWQAAALGMMAQAQAILATQPSPAEITNAFWCACHGGRRNTAELLLSYGADPRWVGHDGLTPIEAAKRSQAADVVEWLLSAVTE